MRWIKYEGIRHNRYWTAAGGVLFLKRYAVGAALIAVGILAGALLSVPVAVNPGLLLTGYPVLFTIPVAATVTGLTLRGNTGKVG